MRSKHEVVDVFWRTPQFTVQILRIPEELLEDKLAVLSNDAGVTKVEYDNFLIQKCLIDVERVGRFIAGKTDDENEELKLVEEIVTHIIEVNPLLNPELLLVTDSGLVKIATDALKGVRLVDTARWKQFPQAVIDTVLDDMDAIEMLDAPPDGVDALLVPVEWPEIDLVVKIYKFNEDDLEKLFSEKSKFFSPVNYRVYIVKKCTYDFTSIMILLDTMGIMHDMAAPQIVDRLFEFVLEQNPFLDMHDLKESGVIEFTRRNPSGKKVPTGNTRRNKKDKLATTDKKVPAKKKVKEEAEERSFSDLTRDNILSLADRLKTQVIGQDSAIETLVDSIQIASCGLRDPVKPIGCFMFTGETGVGKTWLAKVLAAELCGSQENLVRVDCSEYGHGHEIAKLIGAPPGYLGHDAGGQLTNKISEKPFSVVLFDEIEKAHSKLYDILLQILDDGILTDGKGESADFSDCVVILTSNIGVKNVDRVTKTVGFGDVAEINASKKKLAIDEALKKHFKPEFLNRLDTIVTFNSLGTDECSTIIDTQLGDINGYLKDRNLQVVLNAAAKKFVLREGFSKAFGARNIKRTLEKEIIRPLARKMVVDDIKENSVVKVEYTKKKGVSFSPAPAPKAIIKVD